MKKNEKTTAEIIGQDLEVVSNVLPTTNAPQYSDRKWLETNEPIFTEEQTSKKYDEVREPKVQAGLTLISELMGDKINPLVILLSKWWENKVARAAIKKMIDAEAEAMGIPDDRYLQVTLRENVDKLASIQNAVDRLRYSITYFKPRNGLSNKEIYKNVSIKGTTYSVPMSKLIELKEKFSDPKDKENLYAAVIEVSTKVELDEL